MQRFANSPSTKMSPSAEKCSLTDVNTVLTYILIFFLVVLVCYAIVYIFRISGSADKAESQTAKEHFKEQRNKIIGLFWDNCGHCKRFKPVFDQVANEYKSNEMFSKHWKMQTINDTSEAKKLYNVSSFPAIVVVKQDQVVETKVGGMDEATFRKFIDSHASKYM